MVIDANSLTEAGYVSEVAEGIVNKLFDSVYSVYYEGHSNIQECIRKTKYKKYTTEINFGSRDVSVKGVQKNLLRFIEETDIQICPCNKKNPHQEPITVDTRTY